MMRLYICAAAKDMVAERELLHTYVLPELNDRLAEHGIQVAFDDPRAADDYLSLSADERIGEALDRIDRARPWFIAFVGDAIDDAPIALPADLLARHPWLSQNPGASVVELELAYGALATSGQQKSIVYLRDDRFLRDVPLDQRSDYSSDDLEAVGRLETLKAQIREAGVRLVDGYPCRWDAAAGRVNDLDELGKQVIEDLYEAILQAERPEMQIGVLDELPASGAAMGMVNQAADGARSTGSNDADDDLNFDMEDILDVDAGLKESSSASAIEGVEPLDFLDDGPPVSPMSAMEPTINYDANAHEDNDDIGFDLADEVLNIEDVEVAEVASGADDPVDVDVESMFAEAEPLTDLSDMVDEIPPTAEPVTDDSPWAVDDATPIADDVPPAMAAPADSAADNIDNWLEEPVAAAEIAPAAEPVAEFYAEESAADEPPMAEPFFDDAAPAEVAEPPAVEDAFLAEPLAESPPASATQGFDTTLSWSPGAASESAAAEPVGEASLWGDDATDSPDEEMEIDLVDDNEPTAETAEADVASFFDDAAVEPQQAQDDVNHIPLTYGEPANADEFVAEAAEHAEDDGLGLFLDMPEEAAAHNADELEHTVRHNSEATEISDFSDEPETEAVAELEDEFRLQEEPAPVAPAAPVVASSYAPSPARKKKSSLPMILVALALLLLVGGGAGAYFAGLIPGLGKPTNVAQNNPPPVNVDANGLVARINQSNKQLTDLFNTAKSPSGDIDGTKVQAALTLISGLEKDDPEVAAEEPIQAMKTRFTQLATDFAAQANANVETKRQEDFRAALELAGANAPMSLDQDLLAEAQRLAVTDDERNLIVALQQQVADYATEQARLAAEAASGDKKAEAITAIAAAVGDAENYRSAVEAFVTEYPDDAAAAEWKAAQESEPATLDAVASLNKVAADWSKLDMRKLPAAAAQQQLDAANAAFTRTAALPGATEIAQRVELLKSIAARVAVPPLAGAAINAPFVLSFTNGHRLYMTAAPAAKDGKRIATYVHDLSEAGTTAEQEVVAADIDKANSGKSTLPDTAKAVNEALATAEAAWEPAFIKALMTVQADAKMDPVVKTQWLLVIATAGSQGSQPLAAALGDFTKLSETGVDANFNWADPAAAAAAREKCVAALAALPQVRSLAPAIAKAFNSLASLSVPAPVVPVGLLVKNAEGAWAVQLAEGAPNAATLSILISETGDGPYTMAAIGSIEAGEAVMDATADMAGWSQGRVVYASSAAAAPPAQ